MCCKLQRYTIFFIIVNAVHVTGGFSAHHQELKNCTHSIGYMSSLLAATASVGELELNHTSCSSFFFRAYLGSSKVKVISRTGSLLVDTFCVTLGNLKFS